MERAYQETHPLRSRNAHLARPRQRRECRRQVPPRRPLARRASRRPAEAARGHARACGRSRATASPAWTRSITTRSSISSDTVVHAYDNFEYGTHSWPEPYTVSQLGGTYQSIPDFLDNQHRIETAADAEAYLSRLSDFARQLDNETARLRPNMGWASSRPISSSTRRCISSATSPARAAAQSGMTTSLARRTREKNLAGDWAGARRRASSSGEVYPALNRQAETVRGQRANAVHDGGVWRLPEGRGLLCLRPALRDHDDDDRRRDPPARPRPDGRTDRAGRRRSCAPRA